MSELLKLTPPRKGFAGIAGGASMFVAGLKLVVPGGSLFRYAVLPVGVSLIVLVLVLAGSVAAARYFLGAWLDSTWLAWLGSLVALLVGLLIAYFVFVPVINLFAPWFIDPITQQAYRRATGRELSLSGQKRPLPLRVLVALAQMLVGLLIVVFIQLPLAVAGLFTGVTGVLAIAINAVLMGSELMDHPVSAAGGGFGDRVAWLRANFWPAVGLGAAASFCLVIPVLNLFVLPAGAAGATLLYAVLPPNSGEHP